VTHAPYESFAQRGPDHLCVQAESLIRIFSEQDVLAARSHASSLELIVDGYAHVLALGVDRIRLEGEIARLAQCDDPDVQELRELSTLLQSVNATSDRLRELLDAARIRIEADRQTA
jgi:hypothetical protein